MGRDLLSRGAHRRRKRTGTRAAARALDLLPVAVIAGTLFVGLVAAAVTGEIAVFLVILPIVALYALVDRRLQAREPGDDRPRPVRPPDRPA